MNGGIQYYEGTGLTYVKVEVEIDFFSDAILHKKLGIEHYDFDQLEDYDIKREDYSRVEVYGKAWPTISTDKHGFVSLVLDVEVEDHELDRAFKEYEPYWQGDDGNWIDILESLKNFYDMNYVTVIEKDEYISKTQLNSVS